MEFCTQLFRLADIYGKRTEKRKAPEIVYDMKVKKEKKEKKKKDDATTDTESQQKSLTDNLPITANRLAAQRKIVIMNENKTNHNSKVNDDGFDIPLLREVQGSSEQELEEIEKKIKNVKSRLGLLVESDDDQDCIKIKAENGMYFDFHFCICLTFDLQRICCLPKKRKTPKRHNREQSKSMITAPNYRKKTIPRRLHRRNKAKNGPNTDALRSHRRKMRRKHRFWTVWVKGRPRRATVMNLVAEKLALVCQSLEKRRRNILNRVGKQMNRVEVERRRKVGARRGKNRERRVL